MVHIALLMMIKNEQARLRVTLDSVANYINSMIIYDTGSTDNTIDILIEFSKKHQIPLRLKQGEFVDFSTSRNISLDFADTFDDVDFLLLMDCNDELRGGNNLVKLCNDEIKHPERSAYHLLQQWDYGNDTNKYFNVRLIKPRHEWRYKGVVHEYITKPNLREAIIRVEGIVIYQNRNADTDGKTGKRFHRDKVMLLNAYNNDPNEPRTVFYLAQTLECLQENEEALKYYLIRSKQTHGFNEEVFHSFLRAGRLMVKLGRDWHSDALAQFMKAYEFMPRAEPLVHIAEHYIELGNLDLAYTFLKLACNLPYPENAILFVGAKIYNYVRWHLLGLIAYYIGTPDAIESGKNACLTAVKHANNDTDKTNLEYYIKKQYREKC